MDLVLVGRNIKYFRKKGKMSQSQLGGAIGGYDKSWVSLMENGKQSADSVELAIDRIAEALGVSREVLCDQDEEFAELSTALDVLLKTELDKSEAISIAESLIVLASDRLAPRSLLRAYNKRGNVEYYTENATGALEFYNKALEIAKLYGDNEMVHACLQNLAYAYISMSDYKKAESVMANLPTVDNPQAKAKSLSIVAQLFCHLNRWNEAELVIHEVISFQGTKGIEQSLFSCYQYLSFICLHQDGRLDEAYTYGEIALSLAKESDNQLGQVYAMMTIGNALLQLGERVESINYFEKALKLLSPFRKEEILEIKFLISLCADETMEAYRNAVFHISELEEYGKIPPVVLGRYYVRMARYAYKLKVMHDVSNFYEKAFHYASSIVR